MNSGNLNHLIFRRLKRGIGFVALIDASMPNCISYPFANPL